MMEGLDIIITAVSSHLDLGHNKEMIFVGS